MLYCAAVAALFLALYRLDLGRGDGLVSTGVAMLSLPGTLLSSFAAETDRRFLSAVFNVGFYSGIAVVAQVIAEAIDRRRSGRS